MMYLCDDYQFKKILWLYHKCKLSNLNYVSVTEGEAATDEIQTSKIQTEHGNANIFLT